MNWLQTLVTGALPIIAASLTLWLTHRHDRKVRTVEHQREDSKSSRTHLVEFIGTVQSWVTIMEILPFAFAKMTHDDYREFANTDTGEKLSELNPLIRMHALRVKIELGRHEIADVVTSIVNLIFEPREETALLFDDRRADSERFDAALERHRDVLKIKRALILLERLGSAYLANSIAE